MLCDGKRAMSVNGNLLDFKLNDIIKVTLPKI